MNFIIKELSNEKNEISKVKQFLFQQIKAEYGYGYIPEYHQDIKNIEKYYIIPDKSNFFIIENLKTNEIIGTIAIRGYDKEFEEFKNIYTKESTASIWRLFIAKKYRRNGLATKLVKKVEDFSIKKSYKEIYLHTQKTCKGALDFWKSMKFNVTIDTDNELQTVHMIKNISKSNLESLVTNAIAIKS